MANCEGDGDGDGRSDDDDGTSVREQCIYTYKYSPVMWLSIGLSQRDSIAFETCYRDCSFSECSWQ